MANKDLIVEKLKTVSDSAVEEIAEFRGDLSVIINKEHILNAAKLLKEDEALKFEMCKDVTAIDWGTRKNRFTVVYHLYSFKLNFELRLKINLKNEDKESHSLSGVWAGANWYERETFDMYGIKFLNHPDLRRVYMPEEFEYFPLRKEFPVMGVPGSIPLPQKENN